MKARILLGTVGAALGTVSPAAAINAERSAEVAAMRVVGEHVVRLADGNYLVRLSDGSTLTTHGGDPRPGEEPGHTGGLAPGDPERPLKCASDYHQHVLYARPASQPVSALALARPRIEASLRRANHLLNTEALASGGKTADYKVKCGSSGALQIDEFVAPGVTHSFQEIVDAAKVAGFRATNADYSIFYEGRHPTACGIASMWFDERGTGSNWNNTVTGYAVNYGQCWDGATPMHENGHNQGAVQNNAPNSNRASHCIDESDVMCYDDGSGVPTYSRCTDRTYFDCGYDTYFDAAPERKEYLERHWNMGAPYNRFIAFGAP